MLSLSSCSTLSAGGNRYLEELRPLINLREESDLASIFPGCGLESLASSSSSGGVFSYLFSSSVPDRAVDCGKKIRGNIKSLSKMLDRELEAARYEPKQLKSLQKVAEQIFYQRKVTLLKDKLSRAGLGSSKTIEAIDWLNELLLRTIRTPRFENPRGDSSPSGAFLYRRPYVPLCSSSTMPYSSFYRQFRILPQPQSAASSVPALRRSKSASDLLDAKEESRKKKVSKTTPDLRLAKVNVARRQKELLQKQMLFETLIYLPKWGSGWEKKLTDKIVGIEDKGLLTAIAAELQAMQLLAIVSSFIHQASEGWKLIYLLGGASHAVFVEVLYSLPPDIIRFVNGIIIRAEAGDRAWFEEAFMRHRDGFIESCNWMRNRIDDLASTFRQDVKGHLLSCAELKWIDEYSDSIHIRMKALRDYLPPLVDGLTLHPNTRGVLFMEIPKEYQLLLERLKESGDAQNMPPGSIWPIIYGNAFMQAGLEDDDEAYQAFGAWAIYTIDDYREAGLVGDLSDSEWERLKRAAKVTDMCCIENPKKLGINLIADWKRLRVFNKITLKMFLSRPEIREKLTGWSREVLGSNS